MCVCGRERGGEGERKVESGRETEQRDIERMRDRDREKKRLRERITSKLKSQCEALLKFIPHLSQ